MATKIINKKRYQITQVIGTETGTISISSDQGIQSKTYHRRFGKLGDWCARQPLMIGLKHKSELITGSDNQLTLKSKKVTIEGKITF